MDTAQVKLTVFFEEIDKGSLPLVGGKGANLGEMTKEKFPVPPGFAVTVPSYELFLEENKIGRHAEHVYKNIIDRLHALIDDCDDEMADAITTVANRIFDGGFKYE